MKLAEIKQAVNIGMTICWNNIAYTVICDKLGQYLIKHSSGDCIGLTHLDGVTLNGKECEFYLRMK